MGINRHRKEKTEPEHLVNSQFCQKMSWTQMYNVPIASYSSRPYSSVGPLAFWGWINIDWRNTPVVKFAQMMRGEMFASFLDTPLHFSPELKNLLLRMPHNLFWIAMVLMINPYFSSTQDQASSLQIPRQFIIFCVCLLCVMLCLLCRRTKSMPFVLSVTFTVHFEEFCRVFLDSSGWAIAAVWNTVRHLIL